MNLLNFCAHCVVSFICSTAAVEKYVFVEAFQLLLSMEKHRHAVQLLQYHVPPDSLRLARMLLSCERTHDKHDSTTRKALVQAAMDMMMRLKAYHDLVVELLKRHRLMTAMRVVLRHRECFAMESTWKKRGVVAHGGNGGGGNGGGNGGGDRSKSVSGLSTLEHGVPKEAFFRTAVALLRENSKATSVDDGMNGNSNEQQGQQGGGGRGVRVRRRGGGGALRVVGGAGVRGADGRVRRRYGGQPDQ